MHTRRESGRDVNRAEKASSPPSAAPSPRTHSISPTPGPSPRRAGEGRAHPSAVLPAPLPAALGSMGSAGRAAGRTRTRTATGGLLHLRRGRLALRAPPSPPGNTALGSPGSGLGSFFFSLGVGGWLGISPPAHLQHMRTGFRAIIYLMNSQVFFSFPLPSRTENNSHLQLS